VAGIGGGGDRASRRGVGHDRDRYTAVHAREKAVHAAVSVTIVAQWCPNERSHRKAVGLCQVTASPRLRVLSSVPRTLRCGHVPERSFLGLIRSSWTSARSKRREAHARVRAARYAPARRVSKSGKSGAVAGDGSVTETSTRSSSVRTPR